MGFPVYRHVFSKICEDKPSLDIYNHLLIFEFGKQNLNPIFNTIKVEELIDLAQSDPGLYNQTKKIHKDQIWTKKRVVENV